MAKHLQRAIEKIKTQISSLGALVVERVHMAAEAVVNRDDDMAQRCIDGDAAVDELEVELEEECLKMLALYQPVAVDLRFLIATIKINNELERISDLAVNIARRLIVMSKRPPLDFDFDYSGMIAKTQAMLEMSLAAMVNLDVTLALRVIAMDDEVDAIQKEAYDRIKATIQSIPDRVGYLINMLLISRHLERLADHATNIAEEVVYLIEGEIIRHGKF